MADVADADGCFVDAKKDGVVSKRHHPPIWSEGVSREPFRQNVQRIAVVKKAGDEAIRGRVAFGFLHDGAADSGQIPRAPRGLPDSKTHANPS